MASSSVTPLATSLPPGGQGQHYRLISNALPQHLITASPDRRAALRAFRPAIASWHAAASTAQKATLHHLVDSHWQSTNSLDKTLDSLQPLTQFAQPLLEAALEKAGHALDVQHTYIRLYSPVEDSFGRRTGGFRAETFSLLQAALHNFEEQEVVAGFFNSASGFITQPDDRGHFERHATLLKIETFTALCRELDLGGQYQAHLKSVLRADDVLSEHVFKQRYITRQKDAFKLAAYTALLKKDIGESDYALLLRVANGEQNIVVGDKQIWYRRPTVMNLRLHGCLIVEPCVKYRYGTWFIVYLPDDPEHPIKRYENFDEFAQALTERLTQGVSDADRSQPLSPTDYQLFISRFIAQKDQPYYFKRFTDLVLDAPPTPFGTQWLRSEQGHFWSSLVAPQITPAYSLQGDPQHRIRVPLTGPNLHINGVAFKQIWDAVDPWDALFEDWRKRLVADARVQAVPTADADAGDRALRLSHYLNLGLLVVNLVSMAVPPLGYVMLAVTASQLLYETLEGAIELAEGDREAGWTHIGDVLENLGLLAAGAAVFHFTVSPFIENLKAVTSVDGKTRLWKPDLRPYELPIKLPSTTYPSPQGTYRFGGQEVMKVQDRLYAVEKQPDADSYRIQHPSRADAYLPEARPTGHGGWVHEADRPLTWQGPELMRRLGPAADVFDDGQLEQIRRVSDVGEGPLRRVLVESEPVPGVLADTLRQFRAYADAVKVSEQILAGKLTSQLDSYAAVLMTELQGWPATKAIEVYEGTGADLRSTEYGATGRPKADVIRISRAHLQDGLLPEHVVRALSEQQLKDMLGQHAPRDLPQRTEQLRARLAAYAQRQRSRLFNSVYSEQQTPSDPGVRLLQRDFKNLPSNMAAELLEQAPPGQVSSMVSTGKIPLDLALQANRLQQRMRLVRAYEGLYLDALAGPDTEALVLNTLETLPGWHDDLLLEVRDVSLTGPLRASYGPADAAHRKIVVHLADGQYQAFDAEGNQLHGINSLYGSIQHALPDAHRLALGIGHVGQGHELKALIRQHPLSRDALRRVLKMAPERPPLFRPPLRIPSGRRGYPLSGRGEGMWPQIVAERVRTLYPELTDEQATQFITSKSSFTYRWLDDLEAEYKKLNSTLQTWMATPIEGFGPAHGPEHLKQLRLRRHIVSSLLKAWQRTGPRDVDYTGRYRGQRIELNGIDVHEQLKRLPALSANFDHVSALEMVDTDFGDDSAPFLEPFKKGLHTLDLSGGRLTRLPPALREMSQLQALCLADNAIVLTEEAVTQLRGLRRLWILELEGNPLGLSPDISQMFDLERVLLANTGLDTWPVGVFGRPRPRRFYLDLTSNPITRVPEVAPGSERANIVARTFVHIDPMPAPLREQMRLYIESVGLDPSRRAPPRGIQDSTHWMTGLSSQQWHARLPVWDALEESIGAEPFFDELRKLTRSSDAFDDTYRVDLTAKVWRMLEAAYVDPNLRKKLFLMSVAPSSCVDSGAQLFNAMGLEVLLSEAFAIGQGELIRIELLDLAKGKVRLDELGRIARARIDELYAQGRRFPQFDEHRIWVPNIDAQGNQLRDIDEVEIHLAYVTALVKRLDLPWQSSSMAFPEPDVTTAHIEAAYARVKALEQGDLQRDLIADVEWWRIYIENTHPQLFEPLGQKHQALANLQAAQRQWVENGSLSPAQKAELRATVQAAGQLLGKPPAELVPGYVMSDEQYYAEYGRLHQARITLYQRLTDQVMGRVPTDPVQNRK